MQGRLNEARYRSYLVRCWSNSQDQAGTLVWRFSITPVGDAGARTFLARIEDLVAFMQGQLEAGDVSGTPSVEFDRR